VAEALHIADGLSGQFENVWAQVEEAIAACPPGEWHVGTAQCAPVKQVCHILGGCLTHTKPGYRWPEPLRGDDGHFGWDASTDGFPTQAETRELLVEVREHIAAWLRGCSDEDLLTVDSDKTPRYRTPLGRAVYLLRHSQHHLGEVNAEFRRRGIEQPEWR